MKNSLAMSALINVFNLQVKFLLGHAELQWAAPSSTRVRRTYPEPCGGASRPEPVGESLRLTPADWCCLKLIKWLFSLCWVSYMKVSNIKQDHNITNISCSKNRIFCMDKIQSTDHDLTWFSFGNEKVVQLEVDLLPPDILPSQIQLPCHWFWVPLDAVWTNDVMGLGILDSFCILYKGNNIIIRDRKYFWASVLLQSGFER